MYCRGLIEREYSQTERKKTIQVIGKESLKIDVSTTQIFNKKKKKIWLNEELIWEICLPRTTESFKKKLSKKIGRWLQGSSDLGRCDW